MPLYEYVSSEPDDPERSCRICRRGFELRRPVDREALQSCLICKNSVTKRISRVSSPRVTKEASISEAKSAGFTILQKRDEGVYEKL